MSGLFPKTVPHSFFLKARPDLLFMFDELKNLAQNLLSWLVFLLALTVFFFAFGLEQVLVFGKEIFLPFPTTAHSFAVTLFEYTKATLIPDGVELIVISPLTAFLAQMKVALFLSFIVSFPFLLYKLIGFIRPALYTHERRASFAVLTPTTLLFVGGVLFSYFVIIPPTFRILYLYATSLGATSFFGIGEFVALVFALSFTVGLVFLLPVFMYLASVLGLVEKGFWRENWRYAFFSFLVLSAIITPDGSGISMTLLTIPLITLYGVGTIISSNK
ncbi:hypothetical protein CL630_03680 [bacterium]|nr:hypothetical protein [bacterium]|tara:strand:- start:5586 stop:6407 length:822 start_codon:yes stop_codon:yes gene_type:complete